MNFIYTFIVAFIVIAGAFVPTSYCQTVVIAHKDVPQKSISKTELLEIYTLNQDHWEDDSRVKVFDLKQNTATKQLFYNYIDMEQNALRKIWLRKQFTGKALPPKVVDTEKELLESVESTPGAIGYVSISTAKKSRSVNIVHRIR